MPTDDQLERARAALTRAEQLVSIAATEIARARAAGRNALADQMQRDLDTKRNEIQQLRRAYGI